MPTSAGCAGGRTGSDTIGPVTLQTMLDQAATGTVEIEEGWGQGRATFGGLVGSLLLAGLSAHVAEAADGSLPALRSVAVSFVAPAAPGAATVEREILRQGSRVSHAQARLVQDGEIKAVLLASYGVGRESVVSVPTTADPPPIPAVEELEAIPHLPGLTPDFFAQVDLRIADGGWPFSGADTSHVTGWMALREPLATVTPAHLLALVDAWPPSVLQMLSVPSPSSTVTWSMDFLIDLDNEQVDPATHWLYAVTTDQAAGGYVHTGAHIWHPDGRLVAISRQVNSVFA